MYYATLLKTETGVFYILQMETGTEKVADGRIISFLLRLNLSTASPIYLPPQLLDFQKEISQNDLTLV